MTPAADGGPPPHANQGAVTDDLGGTLASLEKLDVSVGRKLAQNRDTAAVKAGAKLQKLADQEPLYALAAVLVVAGLAMRRGNLVKAGVRIGAAVAAADLGKSLLKNQLTRTRPHVLLDEGRYDRGLGGAQKKPEQSFPSGHMAGAVAAARALRRSYPYSTTWTAAACLLLGWGRVSKAAHWPSDVAAGAVVGFVAEGVTERILRRCGMQVAWPIISLEHRDFVPSSPWL